MGSRVTTFTELKGAGGTLLAAVAAAAGIAGAVLAPSAAVGVAPTSTSPPYVLPGAHFPASGVLAAGQHTLVVTQRNGANATLFVGIDRSTPSAAAGAGTLPSWAQPHVGTDANRRRVVIYPRCTGAAVSTCDLYRYDIDSATERRVPGVNAAGVGEVEGSMEKGAIAFTRWTATRQPKDGDIGVTTALYYRPAQGKTRLVTRSGGQQIALSGQRVALVRDIQPSYGECGRPAVQLLGLRGDRRVLRAYRCGLDGHRPVSPTFLGGRLVWAMLGLSEVVFSRWDAPTHTVPTFRLPALEAVAYAPVTWRNAMLLTADYSGTTPAWVLTSVWTLPQF